MERILPQYLRLLLPGWVGRRGRPELSKLGSDPSWALGHSANCLHLLTTKVVEVSNFGWQNISKIVFKLGLYRISGFFISGIRPDIRFQLLDIFDFCKWKYNFLFARHPVSRKINYWPNIRPNQFPVQP